MRTCVWLLIVFTLIFGLVLIGDAFNEKKNVGEPCITKTGTEGTCKSIYSCVTLMNQKRKIRPKLCSISGNTPIICCESPNNPSVTEAKEENESVVSSKMFSPKTERISEQKCEEYSKSVVKFVDILPLSFEWKPHTIKIPNCDYISQPLIVGGNEARVGEYPHMAIIGWFPNVGAEYKWKCGGTLISEKYVLTAAHCTYIESEDVYSPKPSLVRLGEHNLLSYDDGANPIDIQIESIKVSPKKDSFTKYHDIALLLLGTVVGFNKYIRPACLWTKPTFPNITATATGWGSTEFMGTSSNVLQKVNLNLIDQKKCSELYAEYKSRRFNRGIIDEQFCAGDLRGGKDTCQGDSGGPLQISFSSNLCIFYIIGITSFGNACGVSNTAGVYTKVYKYLEWIENEVWGV